MTDELLVCTSAQSVSVSVTLRKMLQLPCLLVVVSANCMATLLLSACSCGYNVPFHHQLVNVCVNGQMADCSVKHIGKIVNGLYLYIALFSHYGSQSL